MYEIHYRFDGWTTEQEAEEAREQAYQSQQNLFSSLLYCNDVFDAMAFANQRAKNEGVNIGFR